MTFRWILALVAATSVCIGAQSAQRGVFELMEVPAGSFTITATRAGYLTVQYGQRRPREAGRTIKVDSGQVIEGIDIALPRGAVLAGRVTDELGEPSPGTMPV